MTTKTEPTQARKYEELTPRGLSESGVSHWIMLDTLLGHFAMWAVRQSPYTVPDNLAEALIALGDKLRPDFDVTGLLWISGSALRAKSVRMVLWASANSAVDVSL